MADWHGAIICLLILAAALIAATGNEGWGWFLFLAFLLL